MEFTYQPRGICARRIHLILENGKVHGVEFSGGCHGNLQGVGRLVEGMDAQEVIARLEGICCGMKKTSCPDQLAQALRQALAKEMAQK